MQPENQNVQAQMQPINPPEQQKPHILKKFPGAKDKNLNNIFMVLGVLVVVVLGVVSGWFLSGRSSASMQTTTASEDQVEVKAVDEVGEVKETDEDKVKEVEGKLVEGGIEGEGTYHIERDGGPSKYVYLTSTSISMDPFVGKKVKIWGITISALHAPWLMDVVKIKTIE